MRVSQLIVDFPEIAELDLNPLIVDADGVVAADAWLRLREAGDPGGGLAITPYPVELTEHWATHDGERLTIRPIRPEDAEQHGAFFSRLSPQDIRYRFFTAMRELSPEQMARLTQIDYDREMAFVAVREAGGETVGVARLVCEDERSGEFAVIVQADMKGQRRREPSHAAADRLGARARIARDRGPGAGGQRADAGVRAASRILRASHAGGARSGGGAAVAGVGCRQWKRPPCAWPPATCARLDDTRSFMSSPPRPSFTLGSALVKALTVDFPVLEIVMFRSIVGFVAMLPMIVRGGGLSALKKRAGPDGAVPGRRRGHGIPHHVEHSDLSLGQASAGFCQVVHIPGERMKMLPIAGIESAQS